MKLFGHRANSRASHRVCMEVEGLNRGWRDLVILQIDTPEDIPGPTPDA